MSKRISKSDLHFHKNLKDEFERQSKPNQPIIWGNNSQPIHFPKRKKKK